MSKKRSTKKKRKQKTDTPAPFDELQYQAEDQVMKAMRDSPQFKAQVADTKSMLKSQQAIVRKKILKGLGTDKKT